MAADGTCDRCGFSLAGLPAEFKVLPRHEKEVRLNCPMCGEQVSVVLQRLGILARGGGDKTQFLRWKVSTTAAGGSVVTLPAGEAPGRFKLRFTELKPIEPREICYPRIPAFAQVGGAQVVPSLPVRKDFLDCVNLAQFEKDWAAGKRADIINGEYQVQLPLHGRDEAVQVRLPLLTSRNAQGEEQRAFKDVNLKVWPNLPITDWRYHLVGLAATGPGAEGLLGENRRVRAFTRGAVSQEWTTINSVQRAGDSLVGALMERPRWIGLEVTEPGKTESDTADVLSGGFFFIPPADKAAAGDVRIGLDFGTSNTCLAFQGDMVSDDKPVLVPRDVEEDKWNLYVVRGGNEARTHKGPDLWPSQSGFGMFKDLYASELLFNRPKVEQARFLPDVEKWNYGFDYGIPTPGVELGFSEADFILGDFKWQELLRGSSYGGDNLKWVQSRYIAAVLMNAYVRAAVGYGNRGWAKTVACEWSYPMSFHDADLSNLTAATEAAQELLQKQTGLTWTVQQGADESAAAATNAGDPGARLHVYLDMGGGSTDIAVKFEREAQKLETVYLTSVRYAGMSLLGAFEGETKGDSCLAGRTTLDVLRRKVRESTDVKVVLDDPQLFNKNRATVTRNRVEHFYGYLVEYVARLLAAGFLDQRFKAKNTDGSTSFPDQMKIAIYFLGNGWRFKGWVADNVVNALRTQVFKRMTELLVEEKSRSEYATKLFAQLTSKKISPVAVDFAREVPHEKAAIALGLLKVSRKTKDKTTKRVGILGWQTSVDGAGSVPWYAMYRWGDGPPAPNGSGVAVEEFVFGAEPSGATGGGNLDTPWYQPHNKPNLDWHDAAPALPPNLEKPFELDPNLNMTRGPLRRDCWGGGQTGWFSKGAYEVMLEDLFRPKLKGIGG